MNKSTLTKDRLDIIRLVKLFYFAIAFLIALLIVAKSVDYFSPDFSKGFLIGKENIFSFYKFFLYAHILFSPVALISGLFQFSFQRSNLHRFMGKIYVVSVLGFASPSGLFMSFFSIGGISSVINFFLLSLLWFLFTLKAYQFIKTGNTIEHKKFMIRSFILANSAVLLRLFSYINNHYKLIDVVTGYNIIVWISWLPILLLFELLNSISKIEE